MVIDGAVRRKDRRIWYVALGVFVMVFLFTFLTGRFKSDEEVGAANASKFDAGYIISDYQMSNYNSMSEAEIQAFLTKKNPCGNTNYGDYAFLSERYPNMKWHFENGHFVCLSEERFGEGVQVGEGETAAHIIYQAAQDYRINPQVLIVLLEKEQGLITDTFPNSVQYRSATGYGCPDTAACDTEYYGFRNQVRHAAALFRAVMDGGWTNYPLGNNYIQYNPNAACGGSVVNIRNLATSALYRYTPYQPNAGALAAGYGQAYCGAYGNRNFYLYFEEWFGGITQPAKWIIMETPRYMVAKKETTIYDLSMNRTFDAILAQGEIEYYVEKTITADNKMCLKMVNDKNNNVDRCVFYEDLEEVSWEFNDMETPRYLEATVQAEVLEIGTRSSVGEPDKYTYYDQKVFLPDGDMCLRAKGEQNNHCVLFSALEEVEFQKYDMETPRYLTPKGIEADIIDPASEAVISSIGENKKVYFDQKIILLDGEICLLVGDNSCVRYSTLSEAWVDMERPREMQVVTDSYKIDAITFERNYEIMLPTGLRRKFLMKRYLYGDRWCLMTEYDFERGTNNCIVFQELSEV